MSDLANICLDIMVDFGQGYCLSYFLGKFLEERKKYIRSYGIIVAVIYGVIRYFMISAVTLSYETPQIILKIMINLMCVIFIALLFYSGSKNLKIFLIITFLAMSEISFFLAYIVVQIGTHLFDLWVWLFEQQSISVYFFEKLTYVTAWGLQLIFYSVFIFLLYILLKRAVYEFRDKKYKIRQTELKFLLIPSVVGLLICVFLRIIMITMENNIPKLLYDRYPVLTVIIPIILILSLFSVLYGIRTFQDMIFLERERSSRIILERQIIGMQEHIKEIERVYSGIRGMKHDMKNTVSVIMNLYEKTKYQTTDNEDQKEINEELKKYLSELNSTFEKFDYRFKTGNPVIDALINMKYHESVSKIPDLDVNAEGLMFPSDLLIHSFDIGIIMGNALDNAIDACRKLKEENPDKIAYIKISSFHKRKMFFIEIENSFNGKIICNKQQEFPESNKSDKEKHGIGLMNIKNIAEKYHGGVDWTVNDDVFSLSIMLKNERRAKQ